MHSLQKSLMVCLGFRRTVQVIFESSRGYGKEQGLWGALHALMNSHANQFDTGSFSRLEVLPLWCYQMWIFCFMKFGLFCNSHFLFQIKKCDYKNLPNVTKSTYTYEYAYIFMFWPIRRKYLSKVHLVTLRESTTANENQPGLAFKGLFFFSSRDVVLLNTALSFCFCRSRRVCLKSTQKEIRFVPFSLISWEIFQCTQNTSEDNRAKAWFCMINVSLLERLAMRKRKAKLAYFSLLKN